MDASTLVSVFHGMLHELSSVFTRPTAETFTQLAVGWVLTPGVGTVTGMIRTLGVAATKHWTVYHKFFYRAAWSLGELSLVLITRLISPLLGSTVDLVIDDTTCGPRGKHVALAGWLKDASAHARHQVIHWARTWKSVTLRKQGRTVRRRIHGLSCQWYHVCRCKPVRVVIVQDPAGREDDLRVVCSDSTMSDDAIVQKYYDRWGVEECIQEGKQQMGMERTRGWCAKTVSRQAPLAMLLSSVVKLWYVQHVAEHSKWRPAALPWYPHKAVASFRDMLGAARRAFWEKKLLHNFHPKLKSNKLAEALIYALCEAA